MLAVYSTETRLRTRLKGLFEELGITYPQYTTLIALNQAGEQTVGELGGNGVSVLVAEAP